MRKARVALARPLHAQALVLCFVFDMRCGLPVPAAALLGISVVRNA